MLKSYSIVNDIFDSTFYLYLFYKYNNKKNTDIPCWLSVYTVYTVPTLQQLQCNN